MSIIVVKKKDPLWPGVLLLLILLGLIGSCSEQKTPSGNAGGSGVPAQSR